MSIMLIKNRARKPLEHVLHAEVGWAAGVGGMTPRTACLILNIGDNRFIVTEEEWSIIVKTATNILQEAKGSDN